MTEAFLRDLERLLGVEHTIADGATLAALGTADFRPGALARPGSTEEVAAVVRLAGTHHVPVVPCGGWTALACGNLPPADALFLSLQRLDRMAAYEPADLVATAQAGMSLGAFQGALFEHGQWLPLDAPAASTLGGLTATGRSGPRRLAYGAPRDMVLGLTYVTGDGMVRKCGGRVVKNVTGYALEKLLTGSHGTLAILTEVTFKLRPRPETASVQEFEASDFETGYALARKLAARWPFSALTASFPGKPFVGQAGIEACPPDHERLLRELEAECSAVGARCRETGAASVDADDWPARPRRLKSIALPSGATVDPPFLARITWPARAGDFSAQIRRADHLALETGFGFLMAFYDFPGLASLELFAEPGAGTSVSPDLSALLRHLRAEGLHATLAWKAPGLGLTEPALSSTHQGWDLMRALKKSLDPLGLLNPGRLGNGV